MKTWDKLYFAISTPMYVICLVIAGLDVGRFGWTGALALWVYGLSVLLYLLGQGIFLWARYSNQVLLQRRTHPTGPGANRLPGRPLSLRAPSGLCGRHPLRPDHAADAWLALGAAATDDRCWAAGLAYCAGRLHVTNGVTWLC